MLSTETGPDCRCAFNGNTYGVAVSGGQIDDGSARTANNLFHTRIHLAIGRTVQQVPCGGGRARIDRDVAVGDIHTRIVATTSIPEDNIAANVRRTGPIVVICRQ